MFASGWGSWMPQPLCIQLILGSPDPATERAYTCGETGWFLTSQKMGQVRRQGTTESVSHVFCPSVKTDKPFLSCHPGSWARVPLVQLGSGVCTRAWEKWGFQGFFLRTWFFPQGACFRIIGAWPWPSVDKCRPSRSESGRPGFNVWLCRLPPVKPQADFSSFLCLGLLVCQTRPK